MSRDSFDRGPWLQLSSGKAFYPLDPRPGDLGIDDIAWGLSRMPRFAGHSREFYSVAEHSVYVSLECDPADALEGLLHDCAESVLMDLPRPTKLALREIDDNGTGKSSYDFLDEIITRSVARHFRLRYPWPDSVKAADNALLGAERRDIMRPIDLRWAEESVVAPSNRKIVPMPSADARLLFLGRFRELR